MQNVNVARLALCAAIVAGGVAPISLVSAAHAQQNCVTLIGDSTLANGCSRRVEVRRVDQGDCDSGCETAIGAESEVGITPIDGRACMTVAWYPNQPRYPNC
jgi:hypothetical protein